MDVERDAEEMLAGRQMKKIFGIAGRKLYGDSFSVLGFARLTTLLRQRLKLMEIKSLELRFVNVERDAVNILTWRQKLDAEKLDGRNTTACNNVLMPVGGFVGYRVSCFLLIFVLWDRAQVFNPRPA